EMAGHANKPVIYISAMSIGFTEFTKGLRKSLPNIAVLQGMDRAVGAIKSLIEYTSLRKEVPDIVSSSSASARALLERALKSAKGAALDEVASKKLLRAYGIPVSREEVAQSAADAVKIAKKIGFPVVAKAVSADILHKSDIGGVVLNLNSAAEVRQLIGRTKAGVKIKGYRGKPALHEASAVRALVGLSNLMADAGNRIASIDVNPFLINAKTGVAVDALIVLNNAAARSAAGH